MTLTYSSIFTFLNAYCSLFPVILKPPVGGAGCEVPSIAACSFNFRLNFLPQIAAMPVSGTPAPTNKRKEPSKMITDFSNISQHGQWRLFVSHIHICSENTCTMGIILDERSLVISCDVQMSVVNVTHNYQSLH